MKIAPLIVLTTVTPLFSQTVTVSAVDGGTFTTGQFLDNSEAFLPFGSLVRVGSFDLTGGNLNTVQTSNDLAQLEALFTPLAEGAIGSGTVVQQNSTGSTLVVNDFGGSGNAFGQITGTSASYLPPGTDLFFWILNTSDVQTATEWAIAGSTSSAFQLPEAPGATTLTVSGADRILRGLRDGDNIVLSPAVPEPSSALFALTGVGFLLGRRRRS